MGVTEELTNLNQLRKDGALTEEEFRAQKEQLLASGNASTPGNKKSKRGLIIGLSIGIPLLALVILLPILLSGPSVDLGTPEGLAQSVVSAIASGDKETFRSLYISEEDREWTLENVPEFAKKPERFTEFVQRRQGQSLEDWIDINQTLTKSGIEPGSLEVLRVVEHDCKQGEIAFYCRSIQIAVATSGEELVFDLRQPGKMGRGWVIGKRVEVRDGTMVDSAMLESARLQAETVAQVAQRLRTSSDDTLSLDELMDGNTIMERYRRDPWGSELTLTPHDSPDQPLRVCSWGPDRTQGGGDDICYPQ